MVSGPIFQHKDPILQQEFQNIYNGIRENANDLLSDLSNLANANILINGGGEVFQRGVSFALAVAKQYVADRFYQQGSGTIPTGTFAQETSVTDGSPSCFKIVITDNTGNGSWFVAQIIENYKDYLGKTLTVSYRVKAASMSGTFFVGLTDGIGNGAVAVTNSAGFVTYSVSLAIDAAAAGIQVIFGNWWGAVGTGTLYIDNINLVLGTVAVPFVPRPFAQEMEMCKRYCRTNFTQGTAPANNATQHATMNATAYTTGAIRVFEPFGATMRTAPTVILYSTALNNNNGRWGYYAGAWSDPTSTTVVEASDNSITVELVKAGAFTVGSSYLVAGYWVADAEI